MTPAEAREVRLALIEGATVPVPWLWPSRLRDLVRTAQAAGWLVGVGQGVDSGGSPFLSVEAREPGDARKIKATWHTRSTGTYRLFSAMLFEPWEGWRHTTAARLVDAPAVPWVDPGR